MTSYTAMARERAPAMLAGPTASPDQVFERWFLRLPPTRRSQVEARLKSIVAQLPESARLAIQRHLNSQGETSPIPLGVETMDGLGCVPCAAFAGLGCDCQKKGMAGLGQWGALASAVASIGTGVWSTMESNDLQKDLAKMTVSSNQQIAAIQANAAIEAQRLLAEAQIETAKQAKEGLVATAMTNAPIYQKLAIGGIAIVGGVAAIGAIIYFKKRKKR